MKISATIEMTENRGATDTEGAPSDLDHCPKRAIRRKNAGHAGQSLVSYRPDLNSTAIACVANKRNHGLFGEIYGFYRLAGLVENLTGLQFNRSEIQVKVGYFRRRQ